jgi:hypothetical protein
MTAPQSPSKPPAKPAEPGRPAPGPGPKPGGPTHPTPTSPQPKPSKSAAPLTGALTQYHLPGLDQIVSDAHNDGTRMLATLRRAYDPATAPDYEAYPGITDADVRLARTTSLVREALRELGALAAIGLPSTIMFPARQDARTANSVPGGPSDHPFHTPGERRSPGYAADAAASESGGAVIPAQATSYPAPRGAQ